MTAKPVIGQLENINKLIAFFVLQDTVFIVACKNGNFEAVKYLTEKYGKLGSSPTAVDPCTKNKEKQNGLYYSVNGNFR